MNVLITICGRGGSKGVKNKNIKEIDGKPLIAYTIEVAKKWDKAGKIVCSTDSEKIAAVAKEYGADVPFMRPDELANDTAGKLPVIRHALKESEKIYGENFDVVVDLDVTCPIRSVQDIDKAFKIFMDKKPDLLFSVVKSSRNPYFNMVELNEEGFARLVKEEPDGKILRRQDAPKVYDIIASIYIYGREFLLNESYDKLLDSKRVAVYEMSDNSAIDIDTELDFKYMEFLIKEGKVSFD